MNTLSNSLVAASSKSARDTRIARRSALWAAALGIALVAAAGLLDARTLHGATHDARHAAGFPCH